MTFGNHKGAVIKAIPPDYKHWPLGQPDVDPYLIKALQGKWHEHNQKRAYGDFFAGFRVGFATGSFTSFDENSPVCGGFGFPKILILLVAIDFLSWSHHRPHGTEWRGGVIAGYNNSAGVQSSSRSCAYR